MADKMTTMAVLLIIFLLCGVGILWSITDNIAQEKTTQCPSGQYAYNETATGTFVCSPVSYTELNNFPHSCPSGYAVNSVNVTLGCIKVISSVAGENSTQCPSNEYAYNETGTGLFLCSYVSFAHLTNLPSGCVSGKFATSINSTALQCSSVAWTQLTGYPSACSTNQFVTAINSTIICAVVSWTGISDFPASCPLGQAVISVGSTLGCTVIPSGNFEVTTQCPSNEYAYNETATGLFICSLISYTQLTGYPSNCGSGQFVVGVSSTLICSTALTSQTSAFFNYGTCASGQFANGITTTTLNCATALTTQTSAFFNYDSCASGYANGITTTTLNCATSGLITPTRLVNNKLLSTATPSLVQNTANTSITSGTNVKLAFGSAPSAHHVLIVCETEKSVTTALPVPSDSLGNTFTQIYLATASATSDGIVTCFSAMSGSGGSDIVSATPYGTTCSATDICSLFIFEISGTDITILTSTVGSATTGTTTPAMTSFSVTNTPLLLGVYVKTTAGTDTAGTSFTLANGETGSITWLTEKSTSLSSVATTFPATFGTSSAYAGVGLIILPETDIWNTSLSANTNYELNYYLAITGSGGSVDFYLFIHQPNALSLVQISCGITTIASSSKCVMNGKTDIVLVEMTGFTTSGVNIFITMTVGNNPAYLALGYNVLNSATTNVATINAGSFYNIQTSS